MIERPSGRLVLLDPRDRLFLFKVHQPTVFDPADPWLDPFWIMIGGLGTMVPERRDEIVQLGMKSIVAGTLATCLMGAVVGIVV